MVKLVGREARSALGAEAPGCIALVSDRAIGRPPGAAPGMPRFLARYARLTISALLCAALALMGFGRIVQSGYPILGALCAALLVLLVLPFHQEASMSAR